MNIAEKYLPHYTVEDYFKWEGDWELIEGVPYAMAPSPFWKHQRTVSVLVRQIEEQLENCPKNCFVCQELDWIVNENTVVRPDVVVICKKIEDYIKSPPEVVFEIVSKSTAIKDENLKFELYEREKVQYYALVYPEIKKMRVFKLKNNKYDKVFDSDSGTFTFEIKCKFTVDLDRMWKRV
ncbi:Endonuclease, Uma2 family (restriction endonuclease fold) [Desulfurobacterium pacificum]|uniref:Endonuclease, Uma2 family (Restriction endonuclease fold) n=1 Tax=Desulfurobacterium pacificum TaxID=240166 RepID=A0ABY1NKS9_9BACT|nr:Uma2 family endonuclease [Desulfurobacterium pacificum]SMP12165.1 Endonuclease, Uma2 family (restriction endonuclease fold) [Desulfurobacterium pacificum]